MVKRLKMELKAMKRLKHPNIVKLMDVIESRESICMILEYCSQGEYFDLISKEERVHPFRIF